MLFVIYDEVSTSNIHLAENSNRGHNLKLAKTFTRTRSDQNRFSCRSVNQWNGLSSDTVNATFVNAFNGSLNRDWKARPDKFSSN